MLITKGLWVDKPDRDLKIIWEGLFFSNFNSYFQNLTVINIVYWHSDKPLYQKKTAEKMTKIFNELDKHGVDK